MGVQGAKIGFKVNVKKTKSQRMGSSKDEEIMLSNEKIDHVDRSAYLRSIISKDGGWSEDFISRAVKA